jgi:hypothetical protein
MKFGLYTLNHKGEPVCLCSRPGDAEGLMAWARWMTKADAEGSLRVDFTKVADVEISTRFLGVNLNHGPSPRVLAFETAVFDANGDVCIAGRAASLKEAQAMHANAVLSYQARANLNR